MQLRTLYGTGGGRIPLENGQSLSLKRHELTALIAAMPTEACRAMHVAARQGDIETAQRLLREAATAYIAATPAPVAAPAPFASRRSRRRSRIA
jgi:hypothetical protein